MSYQSITYVGHYKGLKIKRHFDVCVCISGGGGDSENKLIVQQKYTWFHKWTISVLLFLFNFYLSPYSSHFLFYSLSIPSVLRIKYIYLVSTYQSIFLSPSLSFSPLSHPQHSVSVSHFPFCSAHLQPFHRGRCGMGCVQVDPIYHTSSPFFHILSGGEGCPRGRSAKHSLLYTIPHFQPQRPWP